MEAGGPSRAKTEGDAEIWSAKVNGELSKAQITAKLVQEGYDLTITVVAFKGSAGVGRLGAFASSRGAPSGTLKTTEANAWIFAVGDDPAAAITRTVGPEQAKVSQALDPLGATYWVQSTKAPTPADGTSVTINDTAPTKDPYNLLLVEVLDG